jgi:release factor glutamine methyltransferase
VLLAFVLGRSRAWLYAHPEIALSPEQVSEYEALVARRLAGVPVAYLVGHKEFFGLEFAVTPDVLIPRPDTEVLIETALALAPSLSAPLRIADVGCGSGAITVSLAVHLPHTSVMAVDISPAALRVARQNAARHSVSQRITWVWGDLLSCCAGPFHLIVSNPPYLRLDELPAAREPGETVRESQDTPSWEPRLALDGGVDGLDVVRRLLAQSAHRLYPDGALLVEIGAGQGKAAREIAQARFPSAVVDIVPDYAGRDRVLQVLMKEGS